MKLLQWTTSASVFFTALVFSMPVGEGSGPLRQLTEHELRTTCGGTTTCDNCGSDYVRQDECYHAGHVDDCSSDACLSKILVEDTCKLSDVGSCYAATDQEAMWLIQDHRADTNCQTNNPNTWAIWSKHYYGTDCSTRVRLTRCSKPSNTCNGTLVSRDITTNGIECY
jgi:hypothetical protein